MATAAAATAAFSSDPPSSDSAAPPVASASASASAAMDDAYDGDEGDGDDGAEGGADSVFGDADGDAAADDEDAAGILAANGQPDAGAAVDADAGDGGGGGGGAAASAGGMAMDVYGDLNSSLNALSDSAHRSELTGLRATIARLEADNADLKTQRERLMSRCATLIRNLSFVYETAKTELIRKDNIIAELRAEYAVRCAPPCPSLSDRLPLM
jgi:hypothetical protein